jgi:hypothetical protein
MLGAHSTRLRLAQGRLWDLEFKRERLTAIAQPGLAALPGAVGTTEDFATGRLHPMANDFAAAMLTLGRHYRNRAFETVEHMGCPILGDLKRFVVVVSTQFTFRHKNSPM